MSDTRYPVRIAYSKSEQTYTAEEQTKSEFSVAWKDALKKAHRKAQVHCLCPGRKERRLAVRHLSDSDSFHLSRYPRKGANHCFDCIYHSQDPGMSGLGAYSTGVVEELKSGDLRIKLGLGLRKKDPVEDNLSGHETISSSGSTKPSKPAMRLLGLMHLLWVESQLNIWSPGWEGKRDLSRVHYFLQDVASRVISNGMRLSQALLIATPVSGGKQEAANIEKVASAIRNKRRLVVIAPLASCNDERAECKSNFLSFRYTNGLPRITMDRDLWAHVKVSFKRELAAWKSGHKVVAIVQADMPVSPREADALNIALMVVSAEWIPVESSFEAFIEEKLRKESRRFIKPLRFDSTTEVVFPDFWLTDVDNDHEFPMEVYGMKNPEYLARKAEKAQHYNSTHGTDGWWSWNAADDRGKMNIPPFPTSN